MNIKKEHLENDGLTESAASYILPFRDQPLTHSDIFGLNGEDPLLLRPADVERLYAIPASTVYDWIHEQPETRFPAFKVAVKDESKRRLVLIPKKLLDKWIVERSNLQRIKRSS